MRTTFLQIFISIAAFWVASCSYSPQKKEEINNQTFSLQKFESRGKIIPKDSIEPPVKSMLGPPIVAKAGVPRTVIIPSNTFPVQNIRPAQAIKVLSTVPGQSNYDLPLTKPISSKPFLAGKPEVIFAKSPNILPGNDGSFRSFGLVHGLKHLNIEAITEDKMGNLWMSTGFGGVCKYDGKAFYHFTEKEGLLSNTVLGIYIDTDGDLWFGTQGGITHYDGRYMTNYTAEDGLSENGAFAITEDHFGYIWIGSYNGLFQIDKNQNTITHFSEKNGWTGQAVQYLTTDREGRIWIGGQVMFSILCLNKEEEGIRYRFTNYLKIDEQPINSARTLYEDSSGNMWIGMENGLLKYSMINSSLNDPLIIHYRKENGLLGEVIEGIIEDANNRIWIGTRNGISILTPGDNSSKTYFKSLTRENGLVNNYLLTLYKDRKNNIWMGFNNGGLACYKPGPFHSVFESKELSAIAIQAITEDQWGNIWLGSQGNGLIRYQPPGSNHPGSLMYFTTKEGLADDVIYSLQSDKESIWIGYYLGGLTKFEPTAKGAPAVFHHYSSQNGLPAIFIPRITKDHQGNIWLACQNLKHKSTSGVLKLSGKKSTFFGVKQGLINEDVWTVEQDKSGNFWFGTWGKGVTQYIPSLDGDTGTFRHFTHGNALLDNKVRAILGDQKGNVWVGGIGGGGLTQFLAPSSGENISFSHYTEQEGLSNNRVYAMLEDDRGDIWFGNYYGISRFGNDGSFTNFFAEDGFNGKGVLYNAMYQSSNGDIWIGSQEGLMIINPDGLTADTVIPNIQLMGLSLFTEPINWNKDTAQMLDNGVIVKNVRFDSLSEWYALPENLSLPHFNNFINFDFVGISTDTPQKIRYQYMLKGLEENWSAVTRESKASYGNLLPGHYVFKVKAKIENGPWSKEVAYPFRIRPPWWWNWKIGIVYLMIITSAIILFIQYRIKKGLEHIKAIEAVRTKLSIDLHDDVGSILSGIAMQAEFMSTQTTKKVGKDLSALSGMSRDAMDKMRDIVWALDSRRDKYENLLDRMKHFAETRLSNSGLSYHFNTDGIEGSEFINPKIRQHFYLIFKEAITNALKHSNGDQIIISLKKERHLLQLVVFDNGNRVPSINSDGLGLENMATRAEKMGAQLLIDQKDGFKVIVQMQL